MKKLNFNFVLLERQLDKSLEKRMNNLLRSR